MKWLIALSSLLTCSISFSQKQTIQLNLSVGKSYSHLQQSKSAIVQTINGEDRSVSVEMTAKTNYYIKSAHDSVYNMMVSYEMLSTKSDAGQGETEFSSDSSKHDITSKIFRAFVHKPFLVVMTKRGRIIEMHVDSIILDAVNQIEGLSEQQKNTVIENLKKTFGGEATKGNFEMITAIYPSVAVDINSSWTTYTQLQSLTMMDLRGTYTLKEIHPSYWLLHGDVDMLSQKQDSAIKVNGMPVYYDLSGKMTTDFQVDKKTGWINIGTISQSLKGTIKFVDSPQVPGGMNVPASVITEMSLSDQ